MLSGRSISHVNQGVGKIYSKAEVLGYYNDLTEKVTKRTVPSNTVPVSVVDSGKEIYFPIEIFQYGLGAYDLYLQNHNDDFLQKAYVCADWAVSNQESSGAWVTFAHENKEHPFSAMSQGEGISLLLRTYMASKKESYLDVARKAVSFLLKSIDDGGVAKYDGDNIYLMEYFYRPLILNGWIFALWGLFDYCKIVDDSVAKDALSKTLKSLEKKLPEFDIGYWSLYAEGKMLASPFYHKLHIAQLNALFDLTGNNVYKKYAKQWDHYQNSFLLSKYAFIKKAFQKIFE